VHCTVEEDGVEEIIGKAVSQYKILEQLEDDEIGDIYKVVDTPLNHAVSLKFVR
jgi:hypothetical protein